MKYIHTYIQNGNIRNVECTCRERERERERQREREMCVRARAHTHTHTHTHTPMSPPGTAYCSSFCSANNDTIRDKIGRHCIFPSCVLETIPGRTSISCPTYITHTQHKRSTLNVYNGSIVEPGYSTRQLHHFIVQWQSKNWWQSKVLLYSSYRTLRCFVFKQS